MDSNFSSINRAVEQSMAFLNDQIKKNRLGQEMANGLPENRTGKARGGNT